jgi:hypothetical protein
MHYWYIWNLSGRDLIYISNQCLLKYVNLTPVAHAPVYVNDFPVVNVYVDELSSARIWQDKLCATCSANVDINNRLTINVCYLFVHSNFTMIC